MKRRKFLAYGGAAGLSLLLSRAPKLYADDLVEDKDILRTFSKVYGKVKGRGNEFEFEERIDVNGDRTPDSVTFKLYEGTVTEGTNVTSGKRFELEFKLGGWGKRIYGIVGSEGKIKIAKRRWLSPDDAKTYLDAVLRHYEK